MVLKNWHEKPPEYMKKYIVNIKVNIVTKDPLYFSWFEPNATGMEEITVTASNKKEALDLAKKQLLKKGVDREYIPKNYGEVSDKIKLYLEITSYLDDYGNVNKFPQDLDPDPDAIVEVKVNL